MTTFPIYNCTWHEPSDPAPPPPLPDGLEPCVWTGNRPDVWSDPLTVDQAKAAASVGRAGGSWNWRRDGEGVQTIAAGGLMMLDAENRSDAETRRLVDLFRWYFARVAGPKPAPPMLFGVYGVRFGATDQQFTDGAARTPAFVRGYDMRAGELADLAKKLPVLILETYLYDPLATWLECRKAESEAIRRAYPGKRLLWLMRGDVNGVSLPDDVLAAYVAAARNAADGAIAWGERKNNAAMLSDLVAAH